MNFWFDLNSEELYKNSEKLNSDVCFFISKTANEVHSGIHIYSDDVRDNNLRNIFLGGEIISANITDDYYTLKKINETDTDNFLLLKHIINDQNNKEFVFYLLYTHLLPANHYKFLKLKGTDKYEFKDRVNKYSIDKYYNELLCQHKKIHRFKVYKLYSLFVFQFIALEGFIHFIRYTVI